MHSRLEYKQGHKIYLLIKNCRLLRSKMKLQKEVQLLKKTNKPTYVRQYQKKWNLVKKMQMTNKKIYKILKWIQTAKIKKSHTQKL